MRDRGSKGSASSCRTSSMASSCRSTPTAAGSMVSATLWWKSTAKVLKSMQQQAVKERYHFIAFFWAQVVLVSNSYMSFVFSIRLLQTFLFFLRVCHECPLVAVLCGKSLLISAFISFFFCRRGVPVPGPFGSHLSAECSQSLGTCPHVQCDICKYISLNPLAPLPDFLFAYCLSFWAE